MAIYGGIAVASLCAINDAYIATKNMDTMEIYRRRVRLGFFLIRLSSLHVLTLNAISATH